MYQLHSAIDVARAIYGPMPSPICTFEIFVINFLHINVSLIIVAVTGTKFTYVCIYRSIPTMEDGFISTYVYLTSTMISILGAIAKLIVPGRPLMNHVSTTFS